METDLSLNIMKTQIRVVYKRAYTFTKLQQ